MQSSEFLKLKEGPIFISVRTKNRDGSYKWARRTFGYSLEGQYGRWAFTSQAIVTASEDKIPGIERTVSVLPEPGGPDINRFGASLATNSTALSTYS